MASTAVLELKPAWEIPGARAHARDTLRSGWKVVARNWREFERPDLARRWNQLSRNCAEPNPFLESWCLIPALRAFDRSGDVTLACLENDGQIEGIMPLVRKASYYGHAIPHWRAWLHPNAFLGTPLVSKGSEARFWRELLGWVDGRAGGALFLHLEKLDEHGPLALALESVLASAPRHIQTVVREERALLASRLDAQAYFDQSMSGKRRKELRRQRKRLSELGHLESERRLDSAGIDRWTDEFLRLEQSGWKGDAGSALASNEDTAAFFREALAGAAAAGLLERRALRLDGRAIAMLVNFRRAPASFAFKTAFDENFARFSPGALLQVENLDVLSDPDIQWSDSCAAMNHPMIDQFWRERRSIVSRNVAIGGPVRQVLFRLASALESAAWGGHR